MFGEMIDYIGPHSTKVSRKSLTTFSSPLADWQATLTEEVKENYVLFIKSQVSLISWKFDYVWWQSLLIVLIQYFD